MKNGRESSTSEEELAEPVIQLEDEELVSVPTGHTDTLGTTCLHIPSIGLVVAGDAVYPPDFKFNRCDNAVLEQIQDCFA